MVRPSSSPRIIVTVPRRQSPVCTSAYGSQVARVLDRDHRPSATARRWLVCFNVQTHDGSARMMRWSFNGSSRASQIPVHRNADGCGAIVLVADDVEE